MAGKETEEVQLEPMLDWCRRARLNVDISSDLGTDDSAVYYVRLRPWKQDKSFPIMYQGYGTTALIGARMAITAAAKKKGVLLDYAVRPWHEAPVGAPGDHGDEAPPF